MFNIKQILTLILLLLAPLGVASATYAATSINLNLPASNAGALGQPVLVQWPQNTISLNQLQSVFGQNANIQQFLIQFPNGLQWNVSPANIQTLYNAYTQKATALGYGNGKLPDLSFSSLNTSQFNTDSATIPVRSAIDSMQQEAEAALNALKDKQNSFYNSMPEWLRTVLEAIGHGFAVLYGFARDEIQSLFK